MGGRNSWSWIDELPRDDSDITSANESQSSSCSLSSSSKSHHAEPDAEYPNGAGGKAHAPPIIRKPCLTRLVQKLDKHATLDDQAADLVAKCAGAFVNDISMRIVKLAKYRNGVPSVLDLKFVLKREYNMEFLMQPRFKKKK